MKVFYTLIGLVCFVGVIFTEDLNLRIFLAVFGTHFSNECNYLSLKDEIRRK